tara:strand:- start:1769 stop:1990 length:222 start_codon:yes stop_codon:yes gene_type:complete
MLFSEVGNTFSNQVEQNISKYEGSYIDTILGLCEEHEIEPEIAAKHLSKPIIEKIESEGRSFNLLPKKAKLPI